jgi:hypothetical protein
MLQSRQPYELSSANNVTCLDELRDYNCIHGQLAQLRDLTRITESLLSGLSSHSKRKIASILKFSRAVTRVD